MGVEANGDLTMMPTFLIIGAGKAGTTSLYAYLKQHPDIFMSPIKESNFFAYEATKARGAQLDILKGRYWPVKSAEQYHDLFRECSRERAIGEASPRYLTWPGTAQCIWDHVPDAKLIAILRDPVERAYSTYWMHVRNNREKRTFSQAILDEERSMLNPEWKLGQMRYVQDGLYYENLSNYFELFDRRQIRIYLFEDLLHDATRLLSSIFEFLDVPEDFIPDVSVRHNVSGVSKTRILQPLLGKSRVTKAIRRFLPTALREPAEALQNKWRDRQLVKPPMSSEIRSRLRERFRSDILRLQDLIQRDLSAWQ